MLGIIGLWLCMISLYGGVVWWFCMVGLYGGFVWWVSMVDLYGRSSMIGLDSMFG